MPQIVVLGLREVLTAGCDRGRGQWARWAAKPGDEAAGDPMVGDERIAHRRRPLKCQRCCRRRKPRRTCSTTA